LDLGKRGKVVLGIDYFSIFVFGKGIRTKESNKIVEFFDEVYAILTFESIITDNGREFDNNQVKEWTDSKKVKHILTIPYYQKERRIERFNTTIRDAFRKTKVVNQNLKGILENFNKMIHRGIGMSPVEALKEENRNLVLKNIEFYKREFNKKDKEHVKLNIGKSVIVKEEIKSDKMADEFKQKGVV
jgi:hypothetical protein